MIKKIVLILLLLFIPITADALMIGATQYWYVQEYNPNAFDNTNWYGYTTSTPFASIQFAWDILVVGNTVDNETVTLPYVIVVSTGLYQPAAQINSDINSGVDVGHRIVLETDRFGQHFGTPGETTIKPTNANTGFALWVEEEYITIRGFDLWLYRHGIAVVSTAQAPLYTILEENFIHDNRYNANDLQGMVIFTTAECIIRNNTIADLAGNTNWAGGINITRSLTTTIYNNTIYNISGATANGGTCIFLLHTNAANMYLDVTIKNNIFQKADDYLMQVMDDGDDTNISIVSEDNCFYRDGGTATGRDKSDTTSYPTLVNWRGSQWATDAESIEGDPLTENPGGVREDYKLRGNSICIDSGTVISTIKSDNIQKRRTDGANDIGSNRWSRGRSR